MMQSFTRFGEWLKVAENLCVFLSIYVHMYEWNVLMLVQNAEQCSLRILDLYKTFKLLLLFHY